MFKYQTYKLVSVVTGVIDNYIFTLIDCIIVILNTSIDYPQVVHAAQVGRNEDPHSICWVILWYNKSSNTSSKAIGITEKIMLEKPCFKRCSKKVFRPHLHSKTQLAAFK